MQRIRDNTRIRGLSFGHTELKVSAYADDTLIVMDGGEESLREAYRMLAEFQGVSGLKLNAQKTRAVWIGSNRQRQDSICPDLGLAWEFGSVDYLGLKIDVNSETMAEINYATKISHLGKKLNPWHSRGLTPYGKVHVIKSEALSQLIYLMSVFEKPSPQQIKSIESIMFRFLWGKTEKVKRSTIKNTWKQGGLQVPDIGVQADSLKIAWVRKVLDPDCTSKWKAIMRRKLMISEDVSVFHCDGYLPEMNELRNDKFWSEVLNAWYKINVLESPSGSELLSKPLWHNRYMKLERNVSLSRPALIGRGIITVANLYNPVQRRLRTGPELFRQYNYGSFLTWHAILSSLPTEWKATLVRERPQAPTLPECFQQVMKTFKTAKWAYGILIKQSRLSRPEKAQRKWSNELNLGDEFVWSDVFSQIYKNTKDFKLRWLQLRMIHRILPTNNRLFLYGLRDSNECDRCPGQVESISHIFWFCPVVMNFWNSLHRIFGFRRPLNLKSIILNRLEGERCLCPSSLFICLMLGKHYIWRCRYSGVRPELQGFIKATLHYIIIEKYIATMTNKLDKHHHKWTKLEELLKNSERPP